MALEDPDFTVLHGLALRRRSDIEGFEQTTGLARAVIEQAVDRARERASPPAPLAGSHSARKSLRSINHRLPLKRALRSSPSEIFPGGTRSALSSIAAVDEPPTNPASRSSSMERNASHSEHTPIAMSPISLATPSEEASSLSPSSRRASIRSIFATSSSYGRARGACRRELLDRSNVKPA